MTAEVPESRFGRLRQPAWTAVLAALAVAVALRAQLMLDRMSQSPEAVKPWFDALVLFAVAAWLWWLALRTERPCTEEPAVVLPGPRLTGRRRVILNAGLALVLVPTVLVPAVLATGAEWAPGLLGWLSVLSYPEGRNNPANDLTFLGTALWILGTAMFAWSVSERGRLRLLDGLWDGEALQLRVTREWLAVLAVTLLAAYFRFYQLDTLPLEMTSDHTEKLRDVSDILGGRRPVFLPGNAGREPMQFYWTAALVSLGLPLSFATLKAGMAVLSSLTVPAVYLAARRVAGRQVGLLAALATAISTWHLQITRIGLRIALSPLFVALTLIFLFRALASGRRNDWLALGLTIGAGMYGYSGYRPMALAAVLVVVLKLAMDGWRMRRGAPGSAADAPMDVAHIQGRDVVGGEVPVRDVLGRAVPRALVDHALAALGLSLLVAAPLIRFALDQGETFWGRTASRIYGEYGAQLDKPAWQQLAINGKNTLLMFNLTSDSAWFQSPPGRPALDTVAGALFVLGVVTAAYRLRHGQWRPGALLLVAPLLLLSTAMALAFPQEVPHLSRSAGMLPVAMVLVALPLGVLADRWRAAYGPTGSLPLFLVVAGLFVWMVRNTETRYFGEYRRTYNTSTHPTGQGAAVARAAMAAGVDVAHVYLVGWAHGWDYRALGAHLGDPYWNGLLYAGADGADAVELATEHVSDPAAKLYFVGGQYGPDNVAFLRELYPAAVDTHHRAEAHQKEFWSVYVPAQVTEADGEDGG